MNEEVDRLVKHYFQKEMAGISIPHPPNLPIRLHARNKRDSLRQTILSVAASVIITGLSGLLLMQSPKITPLERAITMIDREYGIYHRTISAVQALQELYINR